MSTHGWITVVACTGELALAILAIRLGRRSRLSLPLAFLSLDLFFWNLAALAYNLSGQRRCAQPARDRGGAGRLVHCRGQRLCGSWTAGGGAARGQTRGGACSDLQ